MLDSRGRENIVGKEKWNYLRQVGFLTSESSYKYLLFALVLSEANRGLGRRQAPLQDKPLAVASRRTYLHGAQGREQWGLV